MKVTNNTIVGSKKGIEYEMGWNGYVANNILLDVEIPNYLSHVYHSWETNKVGATDKQGNIKYTGRFTGEYLFLKWLIWDDEANYLNLEKVTEDYNIYPSVTVKSYMNDPENYDFRTNKKSPSILDGYGSGIH